MSKRRVFAQVVVAARLARVNRIVEPAADLRRRPEQLAQLCRAFAAVGRGAAGERRVLHGVSAGVVEFHGGAEAGFRRGLKRRSQS